MFTILYVFLCSIISNAVLAQASDNLGQGSDLHKAYLKKHGDHIKVNDTQYLHFGHVSKITKHDLVSEQYHKEVNLSKTNQYKADYKQ